MSTGFDPYHEWFGIPPKDQPPNAYRLLGVEPFEPNLKVIENAIDQRVTYLRGRQLGAQGDVTQRMLNEVAAARVLLLSPKKKADYDLQLRATLGTESPRTPMLAWNSPMVLGSAVAGLILVIGLAVWAARLPTAPVAIAPQPKPAEVIRPLPSEPPAPLPLAGGPPEGIPAPENPLSPPPDQPAAPVGLPLASQPGFGPPLEVSGAPASPNPATIGLGPARPFGPARPLGPAPVIGEPVDPSRRRRDPALYPVSDLRVKAGSGAVAYVQDAGRLPIQPLNESHLGPIPGWYAARLPGYRPTGPVALKGVHFVALVGLIPFRQQVEEFEASFQAAMQFDALRDTPKYLYYIVQRAEVSNPNEQPDWPDNGRGGNPNFPIFVLSRMKAETSKWAGPVQDIVDPKHIDPDLTMQPLPLVLRDLDSFLMHPDVERIQAEGLASEAVSPESPAPDDPLGLDAAVPPGPGVPGLGPGRPESGPRPRRGPGPRPPLGIEGPGGLASSEPPPKWKLFRFFDTTVLPGKIYRYRVQLWLEDPNDPKPTQEARGFGGVAAPPDEALKEEVVARINARRAEEAKDSRKRVFWREAPWSEPSPAIAIPSTLTLLVGKVEQPTENEAWRHAEPTGKVAVKQFDLQRARDIAGELDVSRSSVINFEDNGVSIDPIGWVVESHWHYAFVTETIVIDFRGGEKVPRARNRKEFEGLGEALLMDRDGNLLLHREVDPQEYQENLLQFEENTPLLSPGKKGGGDDRLIPPPGVRVRPGPSARPRPGRLSPDDPLIPSAQPRPRF